jgi:hypothetical protein
MSSKMTMPIELALMEGTQEVFAMIRPLSEESVLR